MRRGRFALGLLVLGTGLAWWDSSAPRGSADVPGEAEERLLKSAGIAVDDAALLRFFRDRSLSDGERKKLADLVQLLDHEVYTVREKAEQELKKRGRLALPFLKEVLKDGSLEMNMRAKKCIQHIEQSSGPDLPVAVARLLALRQPKDAVEVLLNYLPYADDNWVEEEILGSLSVLSQRGGKVDPVLLATVKDPLAERRAAAVYVLARSGSLEHRELVRQLLVDAHALVRLRAAQGLVGKRPFDANKENLDADRALLRQASIDPEGPALVKFFQSRSLTEEDQLKLMNLIKQLDDGVWWVRETAQKQLIARGTPALPFLKEAMDDGPLEMKLRAKKCVEQITRGPGPALPVAAARVLTHLSSADAKPQKAALKPAEAIQTLVNYLPFADDLSVEEEVLTNLTILSIRESQLDPQFLAALQDELPARRGAAAYVLGRVGAKEHRLAVHKLLEDPAPRVRLRAAQALFASKDKAAVPALIDLLAKAPDSWMWQVEDLLQRVASDKGPPLPSAQVNAEARGKAVTAWQTWWRDQSSTFDMARVTMDEHRLGLYLVCEYDANAAGNRQGQVWESSRDLKPRWSIKNLLGAMDAQVLANGNVLVAENSANRVSERDPRTGNTVWQFSINNPVACQRLPNGNTFMAGYQQFMEITPTKQVVYTHSRQNFYIFSAKKLKNGNVLFMTAQGQVVEFDPKAAKEVRTITTGQPGGWCGVDALPNGRYLVAIQNSGQVREIDATGKVHWTANYPGVFRCTRLPNGNTLVCSMNTRTIAELDRNGARVWEKQCTGRPWNIHFR
jgi:HEAT repeat protein